MAMGDYGKSLIPVITDITRRMGKHKEHGNIMTVIAPIMKFTAVSVIMLLHKFSWSSSLFYIKDPKCELIQTFH